MFYHTIQDVHDHLFVSGFDESYRIWVFHGEDVDDNYSRYINDSYPNESTFKDFDFTKDMVHDAHEYCKEDPNTLKALLDYCEKPLHNRCKYSTLSGFMKFQYLKEKYGWSDTSFSDLLCTLHDVLPDENSMPKSMYDTKKVMAALGLQYEKIHACQNDCIIFRNEYKDLSKCPSCGVSRWKKQVGKSSSNSKVPSKVLWYFPLIPRFRRMF
ncbi:hypothetical protein Pint_04209 [Pistacia integerrima]|uniref:Uncharacterized protein n=1 Tax=Pistacia integerrima TaxID=434235 RepID=A0ACC0Z5Z8_9ROSI|nr:hypothetical protein Pint_04209 [Pistacia integerrima]